MCASASAVWIRRTLPYTTWQWRCCRWTLRRWAEEVLTRTNVQDKGVYKVLALPFWLDAAWCCSQGEEGRV